MRVAARKSGSESKARERRLRSEQMRNVAKTERRNKESTATAAALRSSQHKEDGKIVTGQDLLPDGEEDLSETLPHTWSLSGCPDARYSGTYAPDTDAPEANLQAHYCNQGGMHLYHKDGWWVLKDIFTPDENSSIARLLSSSNGLLQPGQHTWEWWNDGDWSSIELEMQQNFTPLVVSGTPDGRFSGLYRQDTTHPTANGQPHFSNESRAHLFFGTAKGWCECANCYFASKPHV